MKKLLVLSSMAVAAVFAANAHANDTGSDNPFYVSAQGGLNLRNDSKFKQFDATETKTLEKFSLGHKVGFSGSAAVGYKMEQIRFEIEAIVKHNKNDNGKLTETVESVEVEREDKAEGHYRQYALMVNALYDYPINDVTDLYFGGGLGVAKAKIKFSNDQLESKASDTVFAGQLMTGVAYHVSDNVALTGGYRLFATQKPEFEGQKMDKAPINHSFELGLRYSF